MADPKAALLHPGRRHLKQILGLSDYLAGLTGLPPDVVATEKGLATAMRLVAQSHPVPETSNPIRLSAELVPNKSLLAAVKTHNDLIAAADRPATTTSASQTLGDVLAGTKRIETLRSLIGVAYPRLGSDSRYERTRNWEYFTRDLTHLAKYAESKDFYNAPLDPTAVQADIDKAAASQMFVEGYLLNDATARSKHTKLRAKNLKAKYGSLVRYRIANREDAIRLVHEAVKDNGKIQVEIADTSKQKIKTARKTTGVTLPFVRKPFEDEQVEAMAKLLEATVRNKLSPVPVQGTENDPYKAALIIPRVTLTGRYALDGYFIPADSSQQLIFKSLTATSHAGHIDLSPDHRADIAQKILAEGSDLTGPDLSGLSTARLTGALKHFHPELNSLGRKQQQELLESATYGTSFITSLTKVHDNYTRFATLKFRKNLSELDNSLIGKHLRINGHFKPHYGKHDDPFDRIMKATMEIIAIPDRERVARAFAQSPFLPIVFSRGITAAAKTATFAELSAGKPLTVAVKALLTEDHKEKNQSRLHEASRYHTLHPRTLRAILKLPSEPPVMRKNRLENPGPSPTFGVDAASKFTSSTMYLIDDYYKANASHPELSLGEIDATRKITDVIPSWTRSTEFSDLPLVQAAYLNAFRQDKGKEIIAPDHAVADTIRYFGRRITDVIPETNGDDHHYEKLEAFRQIIAPPGRTNAGLQRLSEQWHHATNRLDRALDAYVGELKEEDVKVAAKVIGLDEKFSPYPVPIETPVTIDGVTITPLKSKDDFFNESAAMNNCVSNYRDDAKHGKLLVVALTSDEGHTTAGYTFRAVAPNRDEGLKARPQAPSFSIYQHPGSNNRVGSKPPEKHVKAVETYLRSILDNKDVINSYNQAALKGQLQYGKRKAQLSPASEEKLREFKFEQLKEFLGKEDRHLTLQQWRTKLVAGAEANIKAEEQRVTRLKVQHSAANRARAAAERRAYDFAP